VPSEYFVSALTLPGAAKERNSQTKPVLAGGAVVTREDPVRGIEVLIIHRMRYSDWTLPKGKVDAGESLPACAVREVLEETGVTIRLGVPLDTVRYDTAKGVKQVEYWGGTVLETAPRPPDDEVDVVSWLPVRAALNRLTHAPDHFLVQQHLDQPPTTPLIILRHGKAMDRKDWSKKDTARPVNARGRRQSRLLVPMLGAYGVSRLLSSTSARCIGTLEPYAHARQLTIDKFSQLTEEVGGDDPRSVAKLIIKLRTAVLATGEPTVICVHRPVLPYILDALDIAPTTLVTGEFLVAHLTSDGEVHALERHRPQA
jgi:8-oxo-dGTP pyrophosphatase MutT (NUDIX family)/phosphohistidine phosphatase SixA